MLKIIYGMFLTEIWCERHHRVRERPDMSWMCTAYQAAPENYLLHFENCFRAGWIQRHNIHLVTAFNSFIWISVSCLDNSLNLFSFCLNCRYFFVARTATAAGQSYLVAFSRTKFWTWWWNVNPRPDLAEMHKSGSTKGSQYRRNCVRCARRIVHGRMRFTKRSLTRTNQAELKSSQHRWNCVRCERIIVHGGWIYAKKLIPLPENCFTAGWIRHHNDVLGWSRTRHPLILLLKKQNYHTFSLIEPAEGGCPYPRTSQVQVWGRSHWQEFR